MEFLFENAATIGFILVTVAVPWFWQQKVFTFNYISHVSDRARSWLAASMASPNENEFLDSHHSRFTIGTAYQSISLGTASGPAQGLLGLAHIWPDTIGRLASEDALRKTRFLDSSRFCFLEKFGPNDSFQIVCVPRGRRFCLRFGENQNIESKEGHVLTCQVAVHVSVKGVISPRSDQKALLDELFDRLPDLEDLLASTTAGILREEAKDFTYSSRNLMENTPTIVQRLNDRIKQTDFQKFNTVLTLQFTGLIFDPIAELEKTALLAFHKVHLHRIETKISETETRLAELLASLENEWEVVCPKLESQLTRLHEIPSRITTRAKGVSQVLSTKGTDEEIGKAVLSAFPSDSQEVNKWCENLSTTFSELQTKIQQLKLLREKFGQPKGLQLP